MADPPSEEEDATSTTTSVVLLLNLLPIVLLSTLSVLLHIITRPPPLRRTDTPDTSGVSRQIGLLLCCCVAHAALALHRPPPPTQPSTTTTATNRTDADVYIYPTSTENDGGRREYHESLIVLCSYLPVACCVLASALRVAFLGLSLRLSRSAVGKPHPTTDDGRSRRRRMRRTMRRIEGVVWPLPSSMLCVLFTALYSFATSSSSAGGINTVGAADGDGHPSSTLDDGSKILPFLFLRFFLSYTLLLLLSTHGHRYRTTMLRLFPHYFSSEGQTEETDPFEKRRKGDDARKWAREEEVWYRWTGERFLEWILERVDVDEEGGGGRSSRDGDAARRDKSITDEDEDDDDSDAEKEPEDFSLRIHATLLPHRIHGVLLPLLSTPDWCAMGLVYGDAVSLQRRLKGLMRRHPAPTHLRSEEEEEEPGRPRAGDVEESRGIDLDEWLSDGGKGVMESRRRPNGVPAASNRPPSPTKMPPLPPPPPPPPPPGMERAQEIFSERFGMALPRPRTGDVGDDGEGSGPAPAAAVARASPAPVPTIGRGTLDSMPPEIREIALRNPELVDAVLQRKRSGQTTTAAAVTAVPGPSLDGMPPEIREIASRNPDLVKTILLRRQRQQRQQRQREGLDAKPVAERPRAPLREHLKSPPQRDYIQPPPPPITAHDIRGNGRAKKDDGDGYLTRVEEEGEEGEEDVVDDGDETVGLLRKRRVVVDGDW